MRRICLPLMLLVLAGCRGGEESNQLPESPPVEHFRVASFDGVKIHHSVLGEGSPTLVFVHGWASDSAVWSRQVEAFQDRYRILTLDLGGHGISGTGRMRWPIDALGKDIQTAVESRDLSDVLLVGSDLGGLAALEAARLMPDRVKGVIGVDTMHNAESKPGGKEWDAQMDALRRRYRVECPAFVSGMFGAGADDVLKDETVTRMCKTPDQITYALLEALARYDVARAMTAAGAPIRCINSASTETDVELNRKYAPGFEVQPMEGVGRFPQIERPDAFNAELERAIEAILGG